jgi:thymidylate synthase
MKREFVPYEQALALKELGFDEHCFKYFSTEITHPENTLFNTRWGYEPEDSETSAPLYQQAFRWFRKKYEMEGITQRAEDFIWYKWTIYQYNENGKNYVANWYEYLTYEEAELECLKKLIEIVKTK